MPLVPDASSNIRLFTPNSAVPNPVQPGPRELPGGVHVSENDNDDGSGDRPVTDDKGNVIKIEHADGTVTISIGGGSLSGDADDEARQRLKWFDNLVSHIDGMELSRIADDLLRGIADDISSREEWVEERASGIRLLALKVEVPGIGGGAGDGAPIDGMSKVRHPLLQEAVLRFQANARSELLPTDGPVKVHLDAVSDVVEEDSLANALEDDMNHYLVSVATEYYPDTDRMLLMLGFGGTAFKKVYFCPIRNRPVSESVDAEDLIVNNDATDLRNARRVTHRTLVNKNTIRRLQLLGIYRDIDLPLAKEPELDAAQEEKRSQQGLRSNSMRPEDRDREVYECYCDLDIKGFEHRYKGKISELEVPYRVTIDVSSREILSITRNYDEPQTRNDLPEANMAFVKYTFVPGLGFYDLGLLHILGNTTNAMTAVWRELLDAGMFASFPGFLVADDGMRQDTNIFRIPPGGSATVRTSGKPINTAVMPLPYKEPSPALFQLAEAMSETGMRLGGVSEQQVGEGRADAPVGTTIAMIEQATKVMNAVHKRMHAAQAEEFRLFIKCFRDHPDSFWKRNKKPAYAWDEDTFRKAIEDYDLVPQADPNTASHSQRVMKVMALKQLQAANPTMYDPIKIDTVAMQAMGWSNPEQFFAPPQAQQAPPPEMQKMQAEAQAKTLDSQARMITAKAKEAEIQAKIQQMGHETAQKGLAAGQNGPTDLDKVKVQTALMDAHTRAKLAEMKRGETLLRDANDQEDRASREKLELLELGKELVLHPENAPVANPLVDEAEGKSEGKPPQAGDAGEPHPKASKQEKKQETKTKTVTEYHKGKENKKEEE
jgi:hypothetical protein